MDRGPPRPEPAARRIVDTGGGARGSRVEMIAAWWSGGRRGAGGWRQWRGSRTGGAGCARCWAAAASSERAMQDRRRGRSLPCRCCRTGIAFASLADGGSMGYSPRARQVLCTPFRDAVPLQSDGWHSERLVSSHADTARLMSAASAPPFFFATSAPSSILRYRGFISSERWHRSGKQPSKVHAHHLICSKQN